MGIQRLQPAGGGATEPKKGGVVSYYSSTPHAAGTSITLLNITGKGKLHRVSASGYYNSGYYNTYEIRITIDGVLTTYTFGGNSTVTGIGAINGYRSGAADLTIPLLYENSCKVELKNAHPSVGIYTSGLVEYSLV